MYPCIRVSVSLRVITGHYGSLRVINFGPTVAFGRCLFSAFWASYIHFPIPGATFEPSQRTLAQKWPVAVPVFYFPGGGLVYLRFGGRNTTYIPGLYKHKSASLTQSEKSLKFDVGQILCRPIRSQLALRTSIHFVHFTQRLQALGSSRAIGPRRWPWLSFFCDQRTGVCDQGAFCPDSNNTPGNAQA